MPCCTIEDYCTSFQGSKRLLGARITSGMLSKSDEAGLVRHIWMLTDQALLAIAFSDSDTMGLGRPP